MKPKTLILAAALLAGTFGRAATNDPTLTLQRGLFEEEANQNLPAAIQAYEEVVTRFDKDRRLAATAMFRLGECYRKQSKTNEAAAQYERVLREFADQAPLVTLSRQSLAALKVPPPPAAEAGSGGPDLADAGLQAAAARSRLSRLKALNPDDQRIAVQQDFPNPVLTTLMQQLTDAQQKLAAAKQDYGPQHPEVLKQIALVETIKKQMDLQIQGVLTGLQIKLNELEGQVAAAKKTQPAAPAQAETAGTAGGSAPATSSEAEEVRRIQALIKDSPDLINARGSEGRTQLHSAASAGQLVVARFLLENGAEVDAHDNYGNTPLHNAAQNGHKAMVELLLSHKADPQALNNKKQTPLHLAAYRGFRSVVEALLAGGADPNILDADGDTPLHKSVAAGQKSIAELLIAHKANVNAKGERGWTPLHTAAVYDRPAVAALLIAQGAEVNARTRSGQTPLAAAVANDKDQLAVVKLLLANKADPNIPFKPAEDKEDTDYPLHQAVLRGRPEIAEALLQAGANPDVQVHSKEVPNGPTPLILAVGQHPELVGLLLKYKANPDLAGPSGCTPLHLSVGQPEVLDKILAAKPNVNAQDKTGDAPLHWAAGAGLKDAAAKLIANGAKVDLQNDSGWTPLHFAVLGRRQDLVDLLLAAKADPNIPDKDNRTPLQIAKTGVGNTYGYNPARGVSFSVPARGSGGPAPGRPAMGTGVILPGQVYGAPAPFDSSAVQSLKKHGAIEDLPRMDRIEVRRGANGYHDDAFVKGTNDWNQFTLLEVIAEQYRLLGSDYEGGGRQLWQVQGAFSGLSIPYPDFSRIRIRRPASSPLRWQEQTADLSTILKAGECSNDLAVAWGDVVEIPEADHPVNQSWSGLSVQDLQAMEKCLTRTITVVVKGQSRQITLRAPEMISRTGTLPGPFGTELMTKAPFWIKPVLRNSGAVLTSCDVSRVKVTRVLPGGERREYTIDCSEGQPAPDFWLRGGDVVTVPDKE
jgi:ankyrin repeat protein